MGEPSGSLLHTGGSIGCSSDLKIFCAVRSGWAAQPVFARYYTPTVRESDVLKSILGRSPSTDPRVLIGPGDDLACVRVASPESAATGPSLLVGVDQVIDGLHVRADLVPWNLIGRKAVCRALSDVAAMVGRPLATVATALLPAGAEASDVEALCAGLFDTAAALQAPGAAVQAPGAALQAPAAALHCRVEPFSL